MNYCRNSSRNFVIDYIRGIAIVFVVLGHNIQFGSGYPFYQSGMYYENLEFKTIYSFHMPLFALLAGFCFFYSVQRPIGVVFKRKLVSLILPILSWVTIEYTCKTVILMLQKDFMQTFSFQTYVLKLAGSFWFLWGIFWCSLIVMVVEKVFKGKVWVYGIIMILLLFAPENYNIYLYVYLYPYFVVGFLFNKYDGKAIYSNWVKDYQVLITATAVWIIMLVFYNKDSYIYTTKIGLPRGMQQLEIDVYRWFIGFAGSIVVIIFCKMICSRRHGAVMRLVAYFGQASLGIYILNSYTNRILSKTTANLEPNIMIWLVETIVSMAVYTVTIEMIKKLPKANMVLLGGR